MNQILKSSNKKSRRIYFKIVFIIILIILLMIPNGFISNLIWERSGLKSSVTKEMAQTWGSDQFITGPILIIPGEESSIDSEDKLVTRHTHLTLLPNELNIKNDVKHEIRKRGIYEAVLFVNKLDFNGSFKLSEIPKEYRNRINLFWNEASINIGINDSHGISSVSKLEIGGIEHTLKPGIKETQKLGNGIHALFEIHEEEDLVNFKFSITLKGSTSMSFEPIANATTIEMSSDWPSPSFFGSTLPTERSIDKNGFTAKWQTTQFNRNWPDFWQGDKYIMNQSPNKMGVKLIQTVDHYQKNTRTNKYSLLIIGLTFFIFFFFENLFYNKIHPIQYALVGLALSLFYLLLLALTEHIGFNTSYWISASAIVLLIIYYTSAILKQKKSIMILFGALVFLYSYIFIILQLEDVALLAGSIGLFCILSVIMGLSRKVNWYEIAEGELGEN